jgi:hypothetical protein
LFVRFLDYSVVPSLPDGALLLSLLAAVAVAAAVAVVGREGRAGGGNMSVASPSRSSEAPPRPLSLLPSAAAPSTPVAVVEAVAVVGREGRTGGGNMSVASPNRSSEAPPRPLSLLPAAAAPSTLAAVVAGAPVPVAVVVLGREGRTGGGNMSVASLNRSSEAPPRPLSLLPAAAAPSTLCVPVAVTVVAAVVAAWREGRTGGGNMSVASPNRSSETPPRPLSVRTAAAAPSTLAAEVEAVVVAGRDGRTDGENMSVASPNRSTEAPPRPLRSDVPPL